MRNFNTILALVFAITCASSAWSQSILDPTDPVINYDSTHPPVQPAPGLIGKWVRTPGRVGWNTDSYKSYIYKGIAFRLKFPKTYNPIALDGKKYPMLVLFHGLGEAKPITDNEDQLFWGADYFGYSVDNGTYDGYILMMQSQGFWGGGHYDAVKEIIDYMVINNKLDPFAVVDNGLSAGGQATWEMFFKYPTYIAAAIPMVNISIWYKDTATVNKVKFTPFWNTHGGLDGSPAPSTCEQVRDAMFEGGANYRNTLYPDVAHFTWPNTWNEPDWWPFVKRAYAANPWPVGGKTEFCSSSPWSTTIGLVAGFNAYQWRKDGVVIPTATSNTITVSQAGIYDARVLRGTVWSEWSRIPVQIKSISCSTTPVNAVRFEAENFFAGNGLNTEPTQDFGGGQDVTWLEKDDWMSYNVNIANAGTYNFSFRLANVNTSAQFQVLKADSSVLATVNVPITGNSQTFRTVTVPITIPAGQQTIKILTTAAGWNLNWWEISNSYIPPPPASNNIFIEAESYSTMSGIQTETTSDTGGGLNVGWQETNDWMEYNVNIATAGTFNVKFRTSTPNNGVQFQLRKSNGTVLATITPPYTAGWQNYQTVSTQVNLPAGLQSLRIFTLDSKGSGWNINWWQIENGSPLPPNQTPVVNAGADQTITLPANSVNVSGSASDSDGSIASYLWSQVSGPSTATIANNAVAATTISALVQGTYTFRLKVTDNLGATATDDLIVTVNSTTPNQPPVVNAGNDQTITLPANSVNVSGTASDGDGNIAGYLWSQVSGPSTATIANTAVASTTISGLVQGAYTFRLKVTDNLGATATDDIVVTVNAVAPPPVNSIKIEAENYSAMFGIQKEATSDVGGGLNVGGQDPNDWADYSVNLAAAGSYTMNFRIATMVSGAQFQVRNSNGLVLATVNVPSTGTYQTWQTISAIATLPAGPQTLRIYTTASPAGWNFNWWEIMAGGNPPPPQNQPPVVNAGSDQTITLPVNSVNLAGTATDGDGNIASYQWTQVTGPSTAVIVNAGSAQTTVNSLVQGIYSFRLKATDNLGAFTTDDVLITVNAAIPPPPPPLNSLKIEAENYSAMFGIQKENTSDVGGGQNVGYQDVNDWMDYNVNLASAGTYTVNFRIATMVAGAKFQLRKSNGTVLATLNVPATGTYQTWQTITTTVVLPAGPQTLRIFTTASPGGWNFNWWEIQLLSTNSMVRGVTAESIVPSTTEVTIYPNPVRDGFNMTISNNLTGKMKIELVNASGRIVKQISQNKTSEQNLQLYQPAGDLAPGIYFVRVSMNGWESVKQISKQ